MCVFGGHFSKNDSWTCVCGGVVFLFFCPSLSLFVTFLLSFAGFFLRPSISCMIHNLEAFYISQSQPNKLKVCFCFHSVPASIPTLLSHLPCCYLSFLFPPQPPLHPSCLTRHIGLVTSVQPLVPPPPPLVFLSPFLTLVLSAAAEEDEEESRSVVRLEL